MAAGAILDPEEELLLRSVLVEPDPAIERRVLSSATAGLFRRVSGIKTLLTEDVRGEFAAELDFDRPSHGTVGHHAAALGEVLEISERQSIDARVIKGMALAHLEPWRTGGRVFGDIDLLVPPADAEALVFALRAAGYAPVLRDRPIQLLLRCDRSIDLVRAPHAIDVHWRMDELLIFDEGSDPFRVPNETLTLHELDGIDVPVVPREHLLLHVAARLGGGEHKARLRGIVDAYALVDDDNDVLHRAATLCPSPIVSARLHLLAEVVRAVNPAMPRLGEPPPLTGLERLHESLAGPSSPLGHWAAQWAAKFIALSIADEYSLSLGDVTKYVLAKRWGLELDRGRVPR